MLVLFAMLLFAIMAMAALVIDIGLARLTQRQMQTAADSAALEGLRFRDDWASNDREIARREKTRQMVGWTYDAGSPDGDNDSINFGATTMAEFSGSAGDPEMFASQLMTIPDEPVYMPSGGAGLQLNWDDSTNSGDNVNGDMVAGNYHAEPPPGASSDAIRDFHKETINELTSDYERKDFDRVDSSLGESGNAFLVRLRRTGEMFERNVRSAGPPLPYLFARGSLINRELIGAGINVRATAIADALPAMAIGSNMWQHGVPGALNLAIQKSFWESWQNDDSDPQRFQRLQLGLDSQDWGTVFNAAKFIGETVAWSSIDLDLSEPCVAYVAIVDEIDLVDRVIGFGVVKITPNSQGHEIEKLPTPLQTAGMVGHNASGRLSDAWTTLAGLSQSQRAEVIERNRSLTHPLLAPVLVR